MVNDLPRGGVVHRLAVGFHEPAPPGIRIDHESRKGGIHTPGRRRRQEWLIRDPRANGVSRSTTRTRRPVRRAPPVLPGIKRPGCPEGRLASRGGIGEEAVIVATEPGLASIPPPGLPKTTELVKSTLAPIVVRDSSVPLPAITLPLITTDSALMAADREAVFSEMRLEVMLSGA